MIQFNPSMLKLKHMAHGENPAILLRRLQKQVNALRDKHMPGGTLPELYELLKGNVNARLKLDAFVDAFTKYVGRNPLLDFPTAIPATTTAPIGRNPATSLDNRQNAGYTAVSESPVGQPPQTTTPAAEPESDTACPTTPIVTLSTVERDSQISPVDILSQPSREIPYSRRQAKPVLGNRTIVADSSSTSQKPISE